VETSLFFMAGISAWNILRKRNVEFFLKAFKIALIMGIAAAPLQIFLGDQSGLSVLAHQPAKAAAMEAWWNTNLPGTSAPWSVVAWPDKAAQGNRFSLDIPYGLSLLAARSLTGQVVGLKDFPVEDQPPIALPYYAFRLMILLGFFMLALVIWALVEWAKGRLKPENAARRTILWKFWLYALPAGFIASESGWVLREVGRQPWIIYGLMRTSDGVSPVGAGSVATTLAIFSTVYLALLVLFIVFTRRIMEKGPDLASPVPQPSTRPAGPGVAGSARR
jgi:cytochrome d ubiquinol oxidase subunit I